MLRLTRWTSLILAILALSPLISRADSIVFRFEFDLWNEVFGIINEQEYATSAFRSWEAA